MLAVQRGESGCVHTLLKWKACINCRDGEGHTPLMKAAQYGNVKVICVCVCVCVCVIVSILESVYFESVRTQLCVFVCVCV